MVERPVLKLQTTEKHWAITFPCWTPSATPFGTVSVSYLSVALQNVSSFLLSSFTLEKKNHLWELSYPSCFFQLFCVQASPLICTSVLYNDFTPAFAYFPNAGTNKKFIHFQIFSSRAEVMIARLPGKDFCVVSYTLGHFTDCRYRLVHYFVMKDRPCTSHITENRRV